MSSNVGSAGTVRTKEPRPGKRTWTPAEARRPGWETESRVWTGELLPEIPPKPSGPRWRVKRWMQLYGHNSAQSRLNAPGSTETPSQDLGGV